MLTRAKWKKFTLAPAAVVLLLNCSYALTDEPVKFGMFPFLPAAQLETDIGPLMGPLSEFLARPVEFRTRSSFEDYLKALKEEQFDIAIVQPFDYVRIQSITVYRPMVRRAKLVKAQFLVNDPALQRVGDLRAKNVAFPSRNSAVTMLGTNLLLKAGLGVNDYTSIFADEHASCLLAVANKHADVCVSGSIATDAVLGGRQLTFRTIAESESISHAVVLYHPRLGVQEQAIIDWFLSLNNTEDGRALLRQAYTAEVVKVSPNDYDRAREIFDEVQSARQ